MGLSRRRKNSSLALVFVAFFIFLAPALSPYPLPLAYAQQSSQVSVTSQNTLGSTITGYYTVLYSSLVTVLSTGFTPVTFSTMSGVSYGLSLE